jgi:membrane-associated phospholipid phosphatase
VSLSPPARSRAALEYVLIGVGVAAFLFAFDGSIAGFAAHLPRPFAWVSALVTQLGTAPYLLAASAVIALAAMIAARFGGARRVVAGYRVIAERAAYVFATIIVAGLAVQVVKHVIGRARPRYLDTLGPYHFDAFSLKASFASFPSGHATTAFAVAGAIGLIWPKARPWLLGLALLIGLSRILLGAHYPSDVVAGAALGLASAIGVAGLAARARIAFRPSGGGFRLRGRRAVRCALASATGGWRR